VARSKSAKSRNTIATEQTAGAVDSLLRDLLPGPAQIALLGQYSRRLPMVAGRWLLRRASSSDEKKAVRPPSGYPYAPAAPPQRLYDTRRVFAPFAANMLLYLCRYNNTVHRPHPRRRRPWPQRAPPPPHATKKSGNPVTGCDAFAEPTRIARDL
jgi:hypothetical protein